MHSYTIDIRCGIFQGDSLSPLFLSCPSNTQQSTEQQHIRLQITESQTEPNVLHGRLKDVSQGRESADRSFDHH